jgi:hypothetical protein
MTDAAIELLEHEQLMSDGDELLYRQITAHMRDGDRVRSDAFGPATADRLMPSYGRSTAGTAQEARDWHTRYATSPSTGVWGVTVGEAVASGRHVVDDSAVPPVGDSRRPPGHCFVDFRGLSKPQVREVRARLYFFAMERKEIPTTETLGDGELDFRE